MDAGDSVTALYEIVPGDGEFTLPTAAKAEAPIDLKYQVVKKEKIELTELAATDDLAGPSNQLQSSKSRGEHYTRICRQE